MSSSKYIMWVFLKCTHPGRERGRKVKKRRGREKTEEKRKEREGRGKEEEGERGRGGTCESQLDLSRGGRTKLQGWRLKTLFSQENSPPLAPTRTKSPVNCVETGQVEET